MPLGRLSRGVDRFLFPASTAETLARFRICFYLAVFPFLAYWLRDLAAPDYPPAIYQPALLGGIRIPTLGASPWAISLLSLFLLSSAVGFLTFPSQVVSAGMALCLFGNPVQYGIHPAISCPLLLCLAIMPFARDADAFSVDALLRNRSRAEASLYGWPTQIVRSIWTWVFFSAGLLKLELNGVDWIRRDGLGSALLAATYLRYPAPADQAPLAAYLLDHSALTRIGSLLTILLELAAPLALFFRPARAVLVPAATLMLLLVLVSLKPPFFFSMMPLLIAWLPWFTPKADPHAS